MKIIRQTAVLFGICLAAEAVSGLLPFSMPGSVIGMLLMTCLFAGGVLKEEAVGELADGLLEVMAMLFVPVGVGVLEELGAVRGELVPILLVILAGTAVTFLGSYLTADLVIRLRERRRGE